MAGFAIFVFLLMIFSILILLLSVKVVPQGMEYTVERFGKYTVTLGSGLNIIVPFVDRIGQKLNMKEQLINVPSQEVISKDNAKLAIEAVIFFQVTDAAKAAYEVENLNNAVLNFMKINLHTVVGTISMDQLQHSYGEINARLLDDVREATEAWGIEVIRISYTKSEI
ncbi:MAG: hypothetical protein GQ569_07330 [Methylococcaceae bacterium]|nr:hypothetical protein [Methylococcaceae bacterium]